MRALLCLFLSAAALAADPPKSDANPPNQTGERRPLDKVEAPLRVRHLPVAEVDEGDSIVLRAEASPSWRLQSLVVHHRQSGQTEFQALPFERSADGTLVAMIRTERPVNVEYYLTSTDTSGSTRAEFASPQLPHPVLVHKTVATLHREAILDVYGNRRSRVSLQGEFISFGTPRSNDPLDWYYRAEADYLYRLFAGIGDFRLEYIRLGMGTLRGEMPSRYVPSLGLPEDQPVQNGIDYGFSEVDVSFHPLFGVSAKLLLGGYGLGFTSGVGARVRIGRPMGARVEVEGEFIGGIGPAGALRLHWDTVPKLPMFAGVHVTGFPGGPPGVRLMYGVAWNVSDALTLGSYVSYNARQSVGGGPAGGLNVAYAW